MTATTEASSGSEGAGHSQARAGGGAVEQPADRPPVADQRGRRAKRAALALGIGERLERVARRGQARFGLGRSRRAGSGPTAEVTRTR